MIVCAGILFFVGAVILFTGKVTISGGRIVTGTRARVVGFFFIAPVVATLLLEWIIGSSFEDLHLVEAAIFFLCLLIGVVVGISDENATRRNEKYADLPPVLTMAEAARYLRVNETKVFQLIQTERLRATLIGGEYRISRESIEELFRS